MAQSSSDNNMSHCSPTLSLHHCMLYTIGSSFMKDVLMTDGQRTQNPTTHTPTISFVNGTVIVQPMLSRRDASITFNSTPLSNIQTIEFTDVLVVLSQLNLWNHHMHVPIEKDMAKMEWPCCMHRFKAGSMFFQRISDLWTMDWSRSCDVHGTMPGAWRGRDPTIT